MFKLIGKVPRKFTLAFSGGVDSVVALDFFSKNHDIDLLFVNHGTKTSEIAKEFVVSKAAQYKLKLTIQHITKEKPKEQSLEEFWHFERRTYFQAIDNPVVTCHHLNDQVETWILTSLHGKGQLIPYRNKNIIRPFIGTKKAELVRWANTRNLTWVEDESNKDLSYMRNLVRHKIMPEALLINPGLYKTIRKKILNGECSN